MSINLNIDGIIKTVSQPQVNIDGVWRSVNVVSNNIDGTWRESYNRSVYKINLYRYGVLYNTLTVAKGNSVTLPSVPTVQSDDIAHYGWTKTAGATSRDYSTTSSITPTADMDLHAVFSYNFTEKANISTTCYSGDTDTITIAYDGTFTINAAYYGSGSNSLVSIGETTAVRVKYNGNYLTISTSSYPYSMAVKKNDTIEIWVQPKQSISTPGGGVTISGSCKYSYPGYKSYTLYRSAYGDCTITLYQGDTVYQTATVPQGTNYTLPTTCPNEKNNVLSGWKDTASSSSYSAGNSIRVSSNINLYAIYYDYSYLDTDGDGYIICTGSKLISISGLDHSSGPFSATEHGGYTLKLTFTDGSTQDVALGNSSGDTTVRIESVYGVSNYTKPADSSSSSNQDGYDGYTVHTSTTHHASITRYIY